MITTWTTLSNWKNTKKQKDETLSLILSNMFENFHFYPHIHTHMVNIEKKVSMYLDTYPIKKGVNLPFEIKFWEPYLPLPLTPYLEWFFGKRVYIPFTQLIGLNLSKFSKTQRSKKGRPPELGSSGDETSIFRCGCKWGQACPSNFTLVIS